MNIDINLELELDGIIGPFTHDEVDGTTYTKFYVLNTNKTLGSSLTVSVVLTDTTIKVVDPGGDQTPTPNTIDALVIRQFLENLQKEAGDSIESSLRGLWVVGYIKVTPEESDFIKTIIVEKSERLMEED